MPTLLWRIEKSEIDEAEIPAFRDGVGCARCAAKPDWLIVPFEGPFAADLGGRTVASGGVIAIRNSSNEILGWRNGIFLGIKFDAAESPV
jgi:hypothetical protein